MMEYVKTGKKIIQVNESETDELFAYLWENTAIEHHGADTDQENDFGEVTHEWKDGVLWCV